MRDSSKTTPVKPRSARKATSGDAPKLLSVSSDTAVQADQFQLTPAEMRLILVYRKLSKRTQGFAFDWFEMCAKDDILKRHVSKPTLRLIAGGNGAMGGPT